MQMCSGRTNIPEACIKLEGNLNKSIMTKKHFAVLTAVVAVIVTFLQFKSKVEYLGNQLKS
jgi:hypothetical protein